MSITWGLSIAGVGPPQPTSDKFYWARLSVAKTRSYPVSSVGTRGDPGLVCLVAFLFGFEADLCVGLSGDRPSVGGIFGRH